MQGSSRRRVTGGILDVQVLCWPVHRRTVAWIWRVLHSGASFVMVDLRLRLVLCNDGRSD